MSQNSWCIMLKTIAFAKQISNYEIDKKIFGSWFWNLGFWNLGLLLFRLNLVKEITQRQMQRRKHTGPYTWTSSKGWRPSKTLCAQGSHDQCYNIVITSPRQRVERRKHRDKNDQKAATAKRILRSCI